MSSMADPGGTEQVDQYLSGVSEPQRTTLTRLRSDLLRLLPHAQEAIKYGMPTLTLQGKAVAGYASFADHCGYYPMSGDVLAAAGDAVSGYVVSKGGLQFPVDRPLPMGLLRTLVKLRLAELATVSDGVRFEFFGDGRLKATGRMKGGELDGAWKWYRKDGSLLRTGRFAAGEQVGPWTTYDRDGGVSRVTRF